ncbi:hypothetical protein HDV01_006844 [Terramyces sp. JEL0728]|nr:hypothetical protein HDV01_006844 [Terramyces sp. JEL0728]
MAALKTAVIAGVGPGIGASLARTFAKEGYHVALLARNQAYLNEIQKELGNATAVQCDLSSEASIKNATQFIVKELPPVEVAVMNAGAPFSPKPFLNVDTKDLLSAFNLQTIGTVHFLQGLLPGMLERQKGTVIITGATAALRGAANFVPLAVPKFATKALAESLAREYGSKGIHVSHVIIDGVVDSERGRAWKKSTNADDYIQPDAVALNYVQLHKQPKSTWTFELRTIQAVSLKSILKANEDELVPGYYWTVQNMMAFENIGFSKINEAGIQYLICADCDLGPLGYFDKTLEVKEYHIGGDRVHSE